MPYPPIALRLAGADFLCCQRGQCVGEAVQGRDCRGAVLEVAFPGVAFCVLDAAAAVACCWSGSGCASGGARPCGGGGFGDAGDKGGVADAVLVGLCGEEGVGDGGLGAVDFARGEGVGEAFCCLEAEGLSLCGGDGGLEKSKGNRQLVTFFLFFSFPFVLTSVWWVLKGDYHSWFFAYEVEIVCLYSRLQRQRVGWGCT